MANGAIRPSMLARRQQSDKPRTEVLWNQQNINISSETSTFTEGDDIIDFDYASGRSVNYDDDDEYDENYEDFESENFLRETLNAIDEIVFNKNVAECEMLIPRNLLAECHVWRQKFRQKSLMNGREQYNRISSTSRRQSGDNSIDVMLPKLMPNSSQQPRLIQDGGGGVCVRRTSRWVTHQPLPPSRLTLPPLVLPQCSQSNSASAISISQLTNISKYPDADDINQLSGQQRILPPQPPPPKMLSPRIASRPLQSMSQYHDAASTSINTINSLQQSWRYRFQIGRSIKLPTLEHN